MRPYRYFNMAPVHRGCTLTSMLGLLFLVHTALFMTVAPPDRFWWYTNFALSWDGISSGKVWQLLTYAFLHADWFHLIINLGMLWFVGERVFSILGQKKVFEIIVAGVMVGGVLHLFASMVAAVRGYSESYLVGVSGACFALLLASIAISPHERVRFIPVSAKNLGLGIVIAEVIMLLMHPGLGLPVFSVMGDKLVLLGMGGLFMVSHACHLGGAMAGWWMVRRVLAPVATRHKQM
jgi:membrane associated rhomboid family serine protease